MEMNFITWEDGTFDLNGPILPAAYLRKEFTVKPGLKSAKMYMTSLGNYIPYVNGSKPDDQLLTPGYTEYSLRLQYQAYDITEFLQEGQNAVSAIVGDGWYRGGCGPMGQRATYGDRLALAARIELNYGDGTEILETDETWRATTDGPIREQDIRFSEVYDAGMEMEGWNRTGFDDRGWKACTKASYAGKLVASEGEKVTEHEHFPAEILHTPDGSTVLDFGQNIAGYVRFKVTGKAGQTVTLIHAEAIDENGNFTTGNLWDGKILKFSQVETYILRDGVQEYKPNFMISGFRYVKLSDWPEEVKAENFEAIAVYSDCRQTGSFECSNEKINRLVQNLIWSQKSNFVDIPTDCPHRERAGWSGDINVFIECADLLCDTRRFIGKWLKDLLLTQMEDGAPLSIVPKVYMMNRKSNETTPGAAGWADAITQIPMRQYLVYGDRQILEDSYEGMKKFVDYNVRRAAENISFRNKFRKNGDSTYILDSGYHYGEWLEPGASNLIDAIKPYLTPDDEVATAWFYTSARTVAEAALVLDKAEDAAKYSKLAENIKAAYTARFLGDGDIGQKRQCKYVRPLYMGLADGETAGKLAAKLDELVRANDYKIGTGFLSTYQILNVLTDNGYNETAYKMLENEECPGWLYEVGRGATTIWEGWDAIDPATGKIKAKSQNHYSPGAALSWLWTRCCGIRPLEPGYKKVEIAPHPGGSMTYARASYISVSGEIVSGWKVEDGSCTYEIRIPEGVDATLVLPDGRRIEHAASGSYS